MYCTMLPWGSQFDHLADRAQWVARWHKIVQVTHREKVLGEGVSAAHGVWCSTSVKDAQIFAVIDVQSQALAGKYFSSLPI
jgi:hypothetical protein